MDRTPNGYKLTLTDVIKYLGIYLDKFLNSHYQLQQVMHKLARAVGMLSKVKHHMQQNEFKNINHSISESHLRYGCQIWFLSSSKFIKDKIEKLQKKALRIMSFSDLRDPSSPLSKKWKILLINDCLHPKTCFVTFKKELALQ